MPGQGQGGGGNPPQGGGGGEIAKARVRKPGEAGPPKGTGQPPLKHERRTRPEKDKGQPSPTVRQGTKVECPDGHRIGVVTGQILNYDTTVIGAMNFQRGQERVLGEPTYCKICGQAWAKIDRVGVTICTKDGWVTSSGIKLRNFEGISVK